MVVGTRSFLLRYGLAVAIFALILVIALLLRYFSIQLNLSVVLAVGLVAAAWFGGRGPGIFLLALILLGAIVIGGVPEGSSAVTVVVGYVSALAVLACLFCWSAVANRPKIVSASKVIFFASHSRVLETP